MGEFFISLGKFLLGAVLKVFVIAVVVLFVWLIICIVINNGFKVGWEGFVNSSFLNFILVKWLLFSWRLVTSKDIQMTLFGLLIFFAPVILLAISTPDPDIELYDSSGNLWKISRG